MKTKSIRWQLSLSYAGIALLATLFLGMILLGILARYFAIQESNYLIETADEIGDKASYFMDEDLPEEELIILMEKFSFYIDAQIRLLDDNSNILVDSGLPQPTTRISLEEKFNEDKVTYAKTIYIGRAKGSPFSSWLFRIQPDDLSTGQTDEKEIGPRSDQVVKQAYYDENRQLLGYIELSNGPVYGREILLNVAWGWAVAALASVVLAAAVGMWVSRRFSNPIESLTHTTAQMTRGNLSARAHIERLDEFGLLANSFNQMADTIEAKVAALRRFVADAAHELGTPLTALRTNLELVNDEHIPSALEQIDRMDSLNRSLLDLSQLEALNNRNQFEDVEMAALLRNLVEPYASRAEQAGLKFDLDIENDPAIIKGDAVKLGTMIQNLLDNAIKFTPTGGQVNVKLSALDDAVQLSITDTGIGIPEDDVAQLFSRFHRGGNASAFPGSGLGLAIVKVIADQHRAAIDVKRKSVGTMFVTRFIPYQSLS